jgi:hypothetical protein
MIIVCMMHTILFQVILTYFVSKTDDTSSTLRTIVGFFLVFLQTSLTEHLSTAGDLLWVSGRTQADQTEEVIRRGLHKLMIVAFHISYTGCHDQAWEPMLM